MVLGDSERMLTFCVFPKELGDSEIATQTEGP